MSKIWEYQTYKQAMKDEHTFIKRDEKKNYINDTDYVIVNEVI